MAQNNDSPGKRLKREEAKNNVNFGFMRPEISPLNQQQFMNVALGNQPGYQGQATLEQLKERMRNVPIEQRKASGKAQGPVPFKAIRFGQKPGSAGETIGKVLTLGEEPMPGQGFSITPAKTAEQTGVSLIAGEAIAKGIKAAAPYVRPIAKKFGKNLYSYYLKKAPWTFKPNPEAYYHRSPDLKNIINPTTGNLQGFASSEAGKAFNELAGPGRTGNLVPGTTINLRKAAHGRLFYGKGTPLDGGRYNPSGQGYKGPYLVELGGVPMKAASQNKTWANPPTRLEGYAVASRPVGMDEAKFYVEDFLRGYRPVKVGIKK
jgi:hypothetical protein